VVLAVLSDRADPGAERTDAPVAEAARVVLDALVGRRPTA
jgi:beta-lactamase class A